MKLKILTLNLHCFAEKNIDAKQDMIIKEIIENNIDIIFLQEVAQSIDEIVISNGIKKDNYGYRLKTKLLKKGHKYNYYYDAFKKSFNKYDEGLAILSKFNLDLVESAYISRTIDYDNWKTRKVIIYKIKNFKINLATVHFGWTDDLEKFEDQFDQAMELINSNELIIIAGDFNVPYDSKEYKHILKSDLIDIFKNDKAYISKVTFKGDILNVNETRIDYIFTNKPIKLIDKSIMFSEKPVSDHFGVYAEIEFEGENL